MGCVGVGWAWRRSETSKKRALQKGRSSRDTVHIERRCPIFASRGLRLRQVLSTLPEDSSIAVTSGKKCIGFRPEGNVVALPFQAHLGCQRRLSLFRLRSGGRRASLAVPGHLGRLLRIPGQHALARGGHGALQEPSGGDRWSSSGRHDAANE